ncbi:MAG TPA: hypothetical protein PLF40_05215 [Kofleriaceae bacterium]|nr:hypothetical protein [Kofleriaceae bacterium]
MVAVVGAVASVGALGTDVPDIALECAGPHAICSGNSTPANMPITFGTADDADIFRFIPEH